MMVIMPDRELPVLAQGFGVGGEQWTLTTQLDRHIDGISGATLSVGAITRLASVALYLHGSSRFAP